MKIKYVERKFNQRSLELIERINAVIDEYKKQHYDLTLRQTYYQLVARNFIENTEENYKRTGELISNARLAGLIDWNAITDRTRNLRGDNVNWTPSEKIEFAAKYFTLDKWTNQPNYLEVWVEKDALIEVVGQACYKSDTPYFSCRGYCSQSEMWQAAQRFIRREDRAGRYIIYLGDHDPSGLDMTRDIADRMNLFGASVSVRRIALTMEQIQALKPPPNFAKITDSRAGSYIKQFGENSWELDALEPRFIEQLITEEVAALMDARIVQETLNLEQAMREELKLLADNYDRCLAFLKGNVA